MYGLSTKVTPPPHPTRACSYICTCALVAVIASLIVLVGNKLICYTFDRFEKNAYQKYISGEYTNIHWPLYENGMFFTYADVYNFKVPVNNKPKFYHLGSSLSARGVLKQEITESFPFDFIIASSSSTTASNYLMWYNYINQVYQKQSAYDVYIFDVHATTFLKSDIKSTEFYSALTKQNYAHVDFKTMDVLLNKHSQISKQIIYTYVPFESIKRYTNNTIRNVFSGNSKLINSGDHFLLGGYFSFTGNDMDTWFPVTEIDQGEYAVFKSLISYVQEKHNVIINLTYQTQSFQNSKMGKSLNSFIDNELTKYLKKSDILYLDNRSLIPQDGFTNDGLHLNYNGRHKFTEILFDELMDFYNERIAFE